jgi:hypothetical protein
MAMGMGGMGGGGMGGPGGPGMGGPGGPGMVHLHKTHPIYYVIVF